MVINLPTQRITKITCFPRRSASFWLYLPDAFTLKNAYLYSVSLSLCSCCLPVQSFVPPKRKFCFSVPRSIYLPPFQLTTQSVVHSPYVLPSGEQCGEHEISCSCVFILCGDVVVPVVPVPFRLMLFMGVVGVKSEDDPWEADWGSESQ